MMYKLVSSANSLIEQPFFYYIVYVDKKEQWTEDRTLGDTRQHGKPLRDLSVNDNACRQKYKTFVVPHPLN